MGMPKPSEKAKENRRSRHRLLVRSLVVGAVCIVTAAAYYSYRTIRNVTLENLKKNALLEVLNSVEEVDRWLATLKAEVRATAAAPTIRTLEWDALAPFLQEKLALQGDIFKFSLIDSNGDRIGNTSIGTKPGNIGDRVYFQRAIRGETYTSDALISRTTGLSQVLIAVPVLALSQPPEGNGDAGDPDEENAPVAKNQPAAIVGVFTGGVKVDLVAKVVGGLSYGKGSYAFALNSGGRAMVHPNPDLVSVEEKPAPSLLESENPDLAAIAQRMTDGQQGIELANIDGEERYVAYLSLQEANWSAALVIPRENIENQLRPLDLIALVVGILAIALLVLLWQIQTAAGNARQKLERRVEERTAELARAKEELERRVEERTAELADALHDLKRTQLQMVQSEKMSALGQMVAGVAHEINNPVNFIHGNLTHAKEYFEDLMRLLSYYRKARSENEETLPPELEDVDVAFLQEDVPKMLRSLDMGTHRIRKIVLSLRNFSRLDERDSKAADLYEGIENTLMLLQSRLKPQDDRVEIQVVKAYGDLPPLVCYPGQLNQVFMNILSNAIDALEEWLPKKQREEARRAGEALPQESYQPQIRIATAIEGENAVVRIADNGPGIPEEVRQHIFNPFFTTKEVGRGTGLGLSISYQIVVEEHRGSLTCTSVPAEGTEFAIALPLNLKPTI